MESLYQTTPPTAVRQSETSLGGLPRASVNPNLVKPIIDRLAGAVTLIVMSPLILISMIMVWISLGRPVVYKQERIGLGGKTFQLYKLRTMIPDRRGGQGSYIGPERRQTHKSPRDPRVTPIGRILRQIRFDELPQLWNVVKGDMSLVGPRPKLPDIVANYEEWQHRRHDVKPGVTGLCQVSEQNGGPMHQYTEIDLEYVTSLTFRNDLSNPLTDPRGDVSPAWLLTAKLTLSIFPRLYEVEPKHWAMSSASNSMHDRTRSRLPAVVSTWGSSCQP